MTAQEMQEAAAHALMLGLGGRKDVRSVTRVNAAGTLVDAEDADGVRFRISVVVQASVRHAIPPPTFP